MKRLLISACGILLCCLMFNHPLFARAADSQGEYVSSDGITYDYYLDEEGHAYIEVDGERQYVLLPLEHLRIQDEQLLEELNSSLTNNYSRSVPTSYYDISGLHSGNSLQSQVYARNIYFNSTPVFTTPVLKVRYNFDNLRIKTTNVVKETFWTDSKINFKVRYYDEISDAWYEDTYNNKDCTSVNGFGIQFNARLTPYIQVETSRSSQLTSLTLSVYTIA